MAAAQMVCLLPASWQLRLALALLMENMLQWLVKAAAGAQNHSGQSSHW